MIKRVFKPLAGLTQPTSADLRRRRAEMVVMMLQLAGICNISSELPTS